MRDSAIRAKGLQHFKYREPISRAVKLMPANRDYDIIVAGGGLAGMIVASSAAFYSKQSLRILVIDRNSIAEMGKKTVSGWVCGDAVGKNTVDYMTNRIGIAWGHPEIEHPVKG